MADKFEELENRIMRTIDLVKTTRQEKAQAEKDLATARKQVGALERELDQLRQERDLVKGKIGSLLEMLAEISVETLA